MRKFYFTFGLNGQPYEGGWVEVYAEDRDAATEVFRKHYPNNSDGYLNCAMIYSEQEFMQTTMPEKGNFGKKCHDVLHQVEKISTETSAGTITAYLNCDHEVAPGITVMLKPDGFDEEIDLVYIEVKQDADLRASGEEEKDVFVYAYGDVHTEDWTNKFQIRRRDVEDEFSFIDYSTDEND